MTDKPKQELPDTRTLTLPGKDYQPCKAEMEREYDMPSASLEMVQSAFFRPFDVRRKDPK